MEIKAERYDEIMQMIFIARNNFIRQFNMKPNTVIINYEDLTELKQTHEFMIQNYHVDNSDDYKVMGMDIKPTDTGKISVGFMVE